MAESSGKVDLGDKSLLVNPSPVPASHVGSNFGAEVEHIATNLTSQLLESAQDIGFFDAWAYCLLDQLQTKCCESPIESLLGAALLLTDRLTGLSTLNPLILCPHDQYEMEIYGDDSRLLIYQFKFESYRIDWAIRDWSGDWTFIECDGHDFHERTKEQAARDRSKDRAVQAAGHVIFRFTGSEIFANPLVCAQQILDFTRNIGVPEYAK